MGVNMSNGVFNIVSSLAIIESILRIFLYITIIFVSYYVVKAIKRYLESHT